MQRFTLLPNHFNWKEQYCFVIEFVIEFPIEREFARRYLRCLIKYSKFTSLHVWCLVIIVELKPFLITCNALNCIFKRDTEKEKEKKKRTGTKHRRMYWECFVFVFVFVYANKEYAPWGRRERLALNIPGACSMSYLLK